MVSYGRSSVGPGLPLWDGIRTQIQAFWGGRRLGVWLLLAAGSEVWIALAPEVGLSSPAFLAACALSCWIPAWAASDLLSVRDPHNPSPHREWSVREFLPRAVGRLLPPLLFLALLCGTFVTRTLNDELGYTDPVIQVIQERRDFLAVWLAWTIVFLASAVAYAAATACCSALFRRPRRWLVTLSVVVAGSSVAAGILEWLARPYLPPGGWIQTLFTNPAAGGMAFLEAPNYLVGSTVAMGVGGWLEEHEELAEWLARFIPPGIAIYCWIATFFFLGGTLLLMGATIWVARRRTLRHPYTGTAHADADEPLPGAPPVAVGD